MQNKLKPASTESIQMLNAAKIRTVMATGDNVLTAIAVGRECNIMDPQIEVFLGEVETTNGQDEIIWKSTRKEERMLDKNTLVP